MEVSMYPINEAYATANSFDDARRIINGNFSQKEVVV